jgi:hypothetical protein
LKHYKYHNFASDVCKKKLVKLCSNAAHKKILSGLGWKILKGVGNTDFEPKKMEGKHITCPICTSHSAG